MLIRIVDVAPPRREAGAVAGQLKRSRPVSARPQIDTEKFKFPFDIKVQICKMRVSPKGVVSSAGRAPALQAGGQRFDPVTTHHAASEFQER